MATVSHAFAEMRAALAARLGELAEANRELENRQARLQALQSELIQRDRLVAAGRLVTELAHEIRNPVANVRNSLEVVRRQVDSPKAREFTDLAIRELLRMHELAERMLDLNRPQSEDVASCDARAVIDDVVALAALGDRAGTWPLSVRGPDTAPAGIAPDALKQVLLNLVTNAQEASPDGGAIDIRLEISVDGEDGRDAEDSRGGEDERGAEDRRVTIRVEDRGKGIPAEILPRIFDPFFTTKHEVHGVGLGLFIAEGVIRGQGGALTAANRDPGPGSILRLDLPAADASDLPAATPPDVALRSPDPEATA